MREEDRGEEETPRNATKIEGEREREKGKKKRVKEAAIKQIWTFVRLVAVDTVSIAEGRGLHGGKPLFFCFFFLVISYAAAPPSPASSQ